MEPKKIIIVGASSGIGRKLAELYSAGGNIVGITGRRVELLNEIKQQAPQHLEYECFDVTSKDVIEHLQKLVNKIGGLDILIISAGIGEPSPGLPWHNDKITVDTNVSGFIQIANWAFNYFIERDKGQLVTISSVAAMRGGSHAPAYNASKAFQSNYFEGLSIKARKLKKNVYMTCIEPGFVDTKMSKSEVLFWVVPVEKAARQMMKAIRLRRRQAFISRRWWLIAKLMKLAPYPVYRRFG